MERRIALIVECQKRICEIVAILASTTEEHKELLAQLVSGLNSAVQQLAKED
jgi:hypothetical protein